MNRPKGGRGGWDRAFRQVAGLYPRQFRHALGEDMCALFAAELARRREQRGEAAAMRYALGTIVAATAGAMRERVHELRSKGSRGSAAPPEPPIDPDRGSEGRTMMGQDVRQDLVLLRRQVRRTPGFAVVVVLTLALGIGVNTGVFSLVRGILLRPLPFPHPEELVYLTGGGPSSLPNLRDLDEGLESMDVMAGVFVPQTMTLTGVGDATQLRVSRVTPDFFRMTGLQPALGRWLGREDEGTHRAVLSHRVWEARFGGDARIQGRTVTLDEEAVEIVGVAPADMTVPFDVDVWTADPWAPGEGPRVSRTWRAVEVYGRLGAGRTLPDARRELATEWARLQDEYPEANGGWRAGLVGVQAHVTRDERTPLEILFLASGLFLLLSCANVASVFLSRLDTRHHEFAVRTALGAGRSRLLRQAWTEALAIGGAGGLAGVGLAALSARAVHTLGYSLPRLDQVAVDGTVVAFALSVTLLTAVAVGSVAVLAWDADDPAHALRRTAAAVVSRSGTLRRLLVVGEVAMAFVIVTGLGLLLRSFQRLEQVDTGVRVDGVVTASLGRFPDSHYPDNDTRRVFLHRLETGLEGAAGIEGAALSSHQPLGGCCSNGPYHRGDDPEREARFVETRWVTPSYFGVLGIPILAGSDLEGVGPDDPPAAIIDQGLAERLFGAESPIGATVVGRGRTLRVVGVAGAVREYSPVRDAPPTVYISARQSPMSSLYLIVRSDLPLDRTVPVMRQVMGEIDPLLPLEGVRSLDDVLAGYTAGPRATTLLMFLLGGLALLLGGVGIYGVTSQNVQGSLREVGVRLVLGARREQVLRGILRNALVLVLPGVALGLVGSVSVRGLLGSLLYRTSPLDPIVYAGVVGVFVVAALVAALGPARRAARVEAVEMLRDV